MNSVLEEALPVFVLAQIFCEPGKLTHIKTNLEKKFKQYQLRYWFVMASHGILVQAEVEKRKRATGTNS